MENEIKLFSTEELGDSMPMLCEDIGNGKIEWGVSFNGNNPDRKNYQKCESKAEALRLIGNVREFAKNVAWTISDELVMTDELPDDYNLVVKNYMDRVVEFAKVNPQ